MHVGTSIARRDVVRCLGWGGGRPRARSCSGLVAHLEEACFGRAFRTRAVGSLKAFGQAVLGFFEEDFGLLNGVRGMALRPLRGGGGGGIERGSSIVVEFSRVAA